MIILLCWAETILIHSLPQLFHSFRTWSINNKYSCVCTRWPRAAGQYLYIYYYWAPLRCSAPRCLVTKEKHSAACRPADLIWRLQSVMIVSADTVITLQESGVSHMSDTLPYWLLFTVYEILNLFLVYCIYIGHSHGVPDISYTAHTW